MAERWRGRTIILLHHPRLAESLKLAASLAGALAERGLSAVVRSTADWTLTERDAADVGCVVSLGGDGTVLRAVRQTAPFGTPIVGVNFGRLGFLAEITPADALRRLPDLLDGGGRLEELLMLRCLPPGEPSDGAATGRLDALNDVFVGRGPEAHAVLLEVTVNDEPLATFVGDGVIVASPTGSTAYSLSAGGPIVAPGLEAVIVTAVAAHPMAVWPIVVPATATIGVCVRRTEDAVFCVDGHLHGHVEPDSWIRVALSPYRACFLRAGPADAYYRTLFERLRS